jgi:hypothetical protein
MQKVGGGSFRFGNRTIKSGEKFRGKLEDIPESVRDTILILDEGTTWKNAEQVFESPVPYELKHVGGGWYDIINTETGKKLNTQKHLRQAAAKQMLEDLKR